MIHRANHKEEGNFTQVSNKIWQDNSISGLAKAILGYALSRPDDWQFYQTEIERHFLEGKKAIRTAIGQLEDAGYLHRHQVNGDKGRIQYLWTVYEQPLTTYPSRVDGQRERNQRKHAQSAPNNMDSTNTETINKEESNTPSLLDGYLEERHEVGYEAQEQPEVVSGVNTSPSPNTARSRKHKLSSNRESATVSSTAPSSPPTSAAPPSSPQGVAELAALYDKKRTKLESAATINRNTMKVAQELIDNHGTEIAKELFVEALRDAENNAKFYNQHTYGFLTVLKKAGSEARAYLQRLEEQKEQEALDEERKRRAMVEYLPTGSLVFADRNDLTEEEIKAGVVNRNVKLMFRSSNGATCTGEMAPPLDKALADEKLNSKQATILSSCVTDEELENFDIEDILV